MTTAVTTVPPNVCSCERLGRSTPRPAKRGDRVEIRATADGNQLDRQNDEIDAAILQHGTGFELSDGRLILHGPFTGLGDLNSNMGPGVKLARKRLHLSATGDLLGSASENSAILLMVFIPGASTMKFWMFWPKLAK